MMLAIGVAAIPDYEKYLSRLEAEMAALEGSSDYANQIGAMEKKISEISKNICFHEQRLGALDALFDQLTCNICLEQ